MEHIYRNLDEADIPWNRTHPPDMLVEMVEGGAVRPCRALDIGCGTGNYSLYLAGRGFEVTGVDLSAGAIDLAR
ncbi:MAG: methyltransferase domain-containing protein, partial [candidate division Zixibacteria bacterium]|nr:methyltransferase domain-containing protein [candidate division Zixibacteria bacterium]NIR65336.1 methyltransferase domain-containing protein [candidate division Zixibacteria bacterium]NIS47319.1 methyltransferase domain-containing protein [candidate division Zixibacteria bacterium]NIU15435.1 methyltransferase domain-containing protein [candidate division Zixibacteria bacterium]NIV07255.1 methyltransferase domain-containing protein [candidate division Zixibacteria bacterium]